MKAIILVALVIWGLFNFSEEIFGFNANTMLQNQGIIGVTSHFLCGKGGCK